MAAVFEELFKVDPMLIQFTRLTMSEIDNFLSDLALNLSDDEPVPASKGPVVSRRGDLWVFGGGKHKLLCGNARDAESFRTLLGDEKVQMCLTDPPNGCCIEGHASRSHGEFLEGSGMNEVETVAFFNSSLTTMIPHLVDGAIVDVFIDDQGMFPSHARRPETPAWS